MPPPVREPTVMVEPEETKMSESVIAPPVVEEKVPPVEVVEVIEDPAPDSFESVEKSNVVLPEETPVGIPPVETVLGYPDEEPQLKPIETAEVEPVIEQLPESKEPLETAKPVKPVFKDSQKDLGSFDLFNEGVTEEVVVSSVEHSVLKATLSDEETSAGKFQIFFSKLFGQEGKPFDNPALFFYLSGFFTMVIILCVILTPFCIYKVIRRRK